MEHQKNTIHYRGYVIKPSKCWSGWDFAHEEYDGAPDACDNRHGQGLKTIDRCIEEINDLIEESDADISQFAPLKRENPTVTIRQKPDNTWCVVIPMRCIEDHELGGHPTRYDAETEGLALGFKIKKD